MFLHIEQIRSRIPASRIIGQKVTLKGRGAGEFVGLCPFHHEKTPSFTVSDNKGFYHCFGCGAHGDVFSFLIEFEGYDYKTALETLANLAGVELPVYNKEQRDSHKRFYDILETITKIYRKNLYEKQGQLALSYIRARGISEATIKKYCLGFASFDRNSLIDELKKKFDIEDIKKSHVFSVKDDEKITDPMRGRLIFPIMEKSGKVIAFGGRILDDGQPKYLNSAENPLFEKGKILYGLNFAQSTMYRTQKVLIVEGYMDILALSEIGIENAVAPLGTSLKIEQIKDLWKLVDTPMICMDADEAGSKAAHKIAMEALPLINPVKGLQFIKLSGGKDPDEVIRNKGKNAVIRCIEKPLNLSEFIFKFFKNKTGYNLPEEKALLKNELDNITRQIRDHNLQNTYRNYFKNELFRLNSFSGFVKQNVQRDRNINSIKNIIFNNRFSYENSHIVTAFYILLRNPELLNDDEISEAVIRLDISDQKLDKIREFLLNPDKGKIDLKIDGLIEELNVAANIVEPQVKTFSHKQILMRALELHSLYIVQQQIKKTEKDLIMDGSEHVFLRLMALKEHESKLKRQLNII
ncbi:MAG: DNA primase [Candidatus Midichloria sp.]|nr:MAG: DNA primase [Candidatus Midichloria sp.]